MAATSRESMAVGIVTWNRFRWHAGSASTGAPTWVRPCLVARRPVGPSLHLIVCLACSVWQEARDRTSRVERPSSPHPSTRVSSMDRRIAKEADTRIGNPHSRFEPTIHGQFIYSVLAAVISIALQMPRSRPERFGARQAVESRIADGMCRKRQRRQGNPRADALFRAFRAGLRIGSMVVVLGSKCSRTRRAVNGRSRFPPLALQRRRDSLIARRPRARVRPQYNDR